MSGLYDAAREAFLNGQINWTTNKIKVVLIDAGYYTVDLSTHTYLSDVPFAARVATSPALTSKTTVAGVADADDTVLPAVSGATVEAFVVVRAAALDSDTDLTASAQRLIAYVDMVQGGGSLALTPSGSDVNLAFDTGPNRIFKL